MVSLLCPGPGTEFWKSAFQTEEIEAKMQDVLSPTPDGELVGKGAFAVDADRYALRPVIHGMIERRKQQLAATDGGSFCARDNGLNSIAAHGLRARALDYPCQ